MILWASKPKPEPAAFPDFGHRTWRRTIDIGLTYISCNLELSLDGGEYQPLPCGYFTTSLTKHFDLGYHMVQYDGYHHCFSLGFLHICWEDYEDYPFLRRFL